MFLLFQRQYVTNKETFKLPVVLLTENPEPVSHPVCFPLLPGQVHDGRLNVLMDDWRGSAPSLTDLLIDWIRPLSQSGRLTLQSGSTLSSAIANKSLQQSKWPHQHRRFCNEQNQTEPLRRPDLKHKPQFLSPNSSGTFKTKNNLILQPSVSVIQVGDENRRSWNSQFLFSQPDWTDTNFSF